MLYSSMGMSATPSPTVPFCRSMGLISPPITQFGGTFWQLSGPYTSLIG